MIEHGGVSVEFFSIEFTVIRWQAARWSLESKKGRLAEDELDAKTHQQKIQIWLDSKIRQIHVGS